MSYEEQIQERIRNLEEARRIREELATRKKDLPHLHGMPWYAWAWQFFQSRNRYNFLVAANQVSKSSTQIRKCIHWATAPEIWGELWRTKPTQFWYGYPDLNVATREFEERWVKEWLPRGEMKDHPIYGWQAVYGQNKKIHSIKFNSGVTVYFISYEMDPQALQAASVYAFFGDEELPVHLYPELNMRLSAPLVQGYWHMVFTATLGQEMWRCTIEERGKPAELFKTAFKLQVTMYDCLEYMDGSVSPWTREMIQEVIDNCSSQAEIDRRVFGKFVLDTDRAYPGFARARNYISGHKLPKGWIVYTGCDIGTGGSAHPAALAYVAVKPDFSAGRVFTGWRGDRITTTPEDILDKHVEIVTLKKLKPVMLSYDHQAKDFQTHATRRRPPIPVVKADKARDKGMSLLNTLFKLGMLKIHDDEPELNKLVLELESLKTTTQKSSAKDDFIDALRFAVMRIPWDTGAFRAGKPKAKDDPHAGLSKRERMRLGLDTKERAVHDVTEDEFDLANEAYDYDFDGGSADFGEFE